MPDSNRDATSNRDRLPLVVDLDGTLSRVDTLHESIVLAAQTSPFRTVLAVLKAGIRGKAALKESLARIAIPDMSVLPLRAEVVDKIRTHREAGGKVVLATGAHRLVADKISSHLGCFDQIFATENGTNLIGPNKRDLLVSRFGSKQFDYIGDSSSDIPVWESAREPWVVGSTSRAHQLARKSGLPLRHIESATPDEKPVWTILRPHQWVKNILVALPVLASHQFMNPQMAWLAFLVFLAFCSCASLVYVGNDLLDRESDRKHAKKSRRPIAAGNLSIPNATALIALCATTTILFASLLPWQAGAGIATYLAANVVYSTLLKKLLLVDVFLLASMYVWRIAVGALATGIELSGWLFGFSIFLFLSLAFAKRYAEVVRLAPTSGAASGRAWKLEDAPFLAIAGISTGIAGAIVLALYVTGDSFSKLYAYPQLVTALSPLFLFWILQLWIQACRKELHEDPVLYASKDKTTYVVALTAFLLLGLASLKMN